MTLMITQLGGIGSPDAYIFKVRQGQNLGSRSYDRREQAVLTGRYLTETTGGLCKSTSKQAVLR